MIKLASFGALGLMLDDSDQLESELTLERTLQSLVIAGTPDSVADKFLALQDDVGAFGKLLYTGHEWADVDLSRRSMELMAKEVWPRLAERMLKT